jgi:hypothetical protein
VVPEGDEDRVYIVVKRTIDGDEVRYIERLHSRYFAALEDAVFVDSALSYDGVPEDTFIGLEHLEGEDVSIIADGEVIANPNNPDLAVVTVSGGQVVLDEPASVVHIGLPYLSDIETLDIDTPQGRSLKESKMKIGVVHLMVEKTKGLLAGRREPPTTGAANVGLQPLNYPSDETYIDDDGLATDAVKVVIESNWDSNGRIFVRQLDPVPVTLLAAIPQGNFP